MGILKKWWNAPKPELLPTPEAYARWAETYPPAPHNPVMEVEQSIVAPLIEAASPRRALDVGTGTGRYLSVLRAAGAQRVVGMDLSMAMLRRQEDRAPLVRADACHLPFRSGTFDLVCASLMAGDVCDLGPWIAEATRVLVPGGQLIYSDFHPSWSAGDWRRTFRASDGQEFELPYFTHSMEDHLLWLDAAALEVRTIREPRVAVRPAPVVVVFHAVKPAPPTLRRADAERRAAAILNPIAR